jgi:hypothetical protein
MANPNTKIRYEKIETVPEYNITDSNTNNQYDVKEKPPAYKTTDLNTKNEYKKMKLPPTYNSSEFYEPHYVPAQSESDKLFGADAEFMEASAQCLGCGLSAFALICIGSIFF